MENTRKIVKRPTISMLRDKVTMIKMIQCFDSTSKKQQAGKRSTVVEDMEADVLCVHFPLIRMEKVEEKFQSATEKAFSMTSLSKPISQYIDINSLNLI